MMARPLAELRVLSMAHAVAMQAKCGVLRTSEIAALTGAVAILREDDPARLPVVAFITSTRTHGRQPAALIAAGGTLQQAVRRALWPADQGRSDLHG